MTINKQTINITRHTNLFYIYVHEESRNVERHNTRTNEKEKGLNESITTATLYVSLSYSLVVSTGNN